MARSPNSDDARALAKVTARVLRDGAQALYRDPALFDQLYRRRRRDVAFYLRCAQRYGGPVLELGTGSGRVAIALARAGVEVVGVDTMPSMLEAARSLLTKQPARVAKRVTLARGDLRRVRLRRRFPLVIAPFNTFMHLYSRDDLERALATCRAHLAPRGRLVFDVQMPDLRALLQDPERLYACPSLRHPNTGTLYRLHEASHYDPIAQVRSVTMVLEPAALQPDATSGSAPRMAVPLAQRQWFPAELEALLHYNGFASEARLGDFDGAPLRPDSEVQIVVARPKTRR
jgi:SAM-dependent methyltransferase